MIALHLFELSLMPVCRFAVRFLLFFCWCLALAGTTWAAEPNASERAWLEAHPVVRVGVARQDWAPIDLIGADGRYTGMSADMLARIAKQAGVIVEVRVLPDFPDVLAKLRSGEIDMAPSMARTPGRLEFLEFTQPYMDSPVVLIARGDAPEIATNATLDGRRVAVERGYQAVELLPHRYPRARPVPFDSTAQALRAVSEGRADAYIGSLAPAAYVIERDLLAGLAVRGPVDIDPGLRFGVRKEAAVLASLFDRAIAEIGPEAQEAVTRNWMPVPVQLARTAGPVRLNTAQQAWVQVHSNLRVGYIADYAPLAERDADGQMRGLFADQLNLVTGRLGLRLKSVHGYTLASLQEALQRREIDVAFGLTPNPEREAFARFVGPLLTTATVAVTRTDSEFFHEPNQFLGQTIAMKRGHFLIPRLRRSYPAIRVLEFDTLSATLDAVMRGEAVATFSDLTAIGPPLSGAYSGVLKVAGVWRDAPSELGMAVRDDWPELASILRLGLDSVTPAERHRMEKTWLAPSYAFVVPWRRLIALGMPIIASLVVVLVVVTLWNRRLRAEVARRRDMEEALISARDAAFDSADRKAAFLAALSHEIRTPMNGVMGLLDALSYSGLNDGQRFQLSVVARSARMALGILNDALDFARIEAGRLVLDPKMTDARPIAEEVASMFAPLAAERGVALQLSVAPHLPLLNIDGMRVQQIVANLVQNALRSTERGFVRIRLTGAPVTTRRWRLTVEIEDTGLGIPESVRSRIFKPFEPLGGPSAPGSGIGLAICRALADAMRGQLDFESAQGAGSRFRLTLEADAALTGSADDRPFVGVGVRLMCNDALWRNECSGWLRAWGARIVEPPSPEAAQVVISDGPVAVPARSVVVLLRDPSASVSTTPDGTVQLAAQPLLPSRLRNAVAAALTPRPYPPLALAGGGAPRKVLVVDDEPLNLRVAKELLGLLGFDARLASEAQAGFEAFCTDTFVAVLLDFRMPGEDGVSLAVRMRQRERNKALTPTPIAAVTADASEQTASACIAAGMNSVVLKPLTLDTLYAAMEALGCAPERPEGLASLDPEEEASDPLAHLTALLGSADRARSIAQGFIVASCEDMVGLRDKLDVEDFDAVRFLAHRIKGGARNAGFELVGEAAANLEQAAKDGHGEAIRHLTVQLTRALERLRGRLAVETAESTA